ncbi:hypothetical protein D3C81_2144090 [compost metagenome]
MRFNIIQLSDNVLFHHGIHFVDSVIPGFLLDYRFRRIGVVQPVGYRRHRIQTLAFSNRFHRTTVGVPTDNDIRHA